MKSAKSLITLFSCMALTLAISRAATPDSASERRLDAESEKPAGAHAPEKERADSARGDKVPSAERGGPKVNAEHNSSEKPDKTAKISRTVGNFKPPGGEKHSVDAQAAHKRTLGDPHSEKAPASTVHLERSLSNTDDAKPVAARPQESRTAASPRADSLAQGPAPGPAAPRPVARLAAMPPSPPRTRNPGTEVLGGMANMSRATPVLSGSSMKSRN